MVASCSTSIRRGRARGSRRRRVHGWSRSSPHDACPARTAVVVAARRARHATTAAARSASTTGRIGTSRAASERSANLVVFAAHGDEHPGHVPRRRGAHGRLTFRSVSDASAKKAACPSLRRCCTTKHRRDDDNRLYSMGKRRHALSQSCQVCFRQQDILRERRISIREDRERHFEPKSASFLRRLDKN